MLTDEEIPSLDSIEPREALTFEQRLAALEASLEELTHRLETRLAGQVRRVEQSVLEQAVQTRAEVSRESTARLDQFTKLALKLSRHLDRLENTPSTDEH